MLIVSKKLGIVESLRFCPEDTPEKRFKFEVSQWVNSRIKDLQGSDFVSLYSCYGALLAVFKVFVHGPTVAVAVPNDKGLPKDCQSYLADNGDVAPGSNPWEAALSVSKTVEVGGKVSIYCLNTVTVYDYLKLCTVYPNKINKDFEGTFDKLQLVDRYVLRK